MSDDVRESGRGCARPGRPGRRPTIADVARQAGVGAGTVSRVLNESPLVSAGTRRRVLDVMAELDYRPSSAARQLSRGVTHTIGVLMSFFGNPSAVERLRGLMPQLSRAGYDFALADVESMEERDRAFAHLLDSSRVDAVLIVSLVPSQLELDQLASATMPIVFLDRLQAGMPCVATDDVQGGRIAAEHLIALGHRRIAFIGDLPGRHFFTSSADRRTGFLQALSAAGIEPDPMLVVEAPNGRERAQAVADRLLSLPERPTAVFAASDVQAFGVMEAARARGLAVPDDLSVIGFDDIEAAGFVGLSTVRQPLRESGEAAANMLLELIDGRRLERPVVLLPLELVPRSTTAPPRG